MDTLVSESKIVKRKIKQDEQWKKQEEFQEEMETYKFKETSLHLIEGLNSTLGTSLDKFHIPLQGL